MCLIGTTSAAPIRCARAGLAALAMLAAVLALAAGAPATPGPACAGALSRDPDRPCRNPALRTTVTPLPVDAVLTPTAPCRLVSEDGLIDSCRFGLTPDRATRTVALLGDSHAAHWRAALAGAAARRGWHGVSLTKDSCPFTLAVPLVSPGSREACAAHNAGVLRWLRAHREVRTVFVSAHTGARIVRAPGRNALQTKVRGHQDAWAALPAHVDRVVVLRDVPPHPARTSDCVARAAARHADAGTLCAVPRRTLVADPQTVATRTLTPARFSVVDATPILCGPRACYPVIGGVLVNKDTDHLTRRFSATLAPLVLRVTDRVLPPVARRRAGAAGAGR